MRALRLLCLVVTALLGVSLVALPTATAGYPYQGQATITAPYPGFLHVKGWARHDQYPSDRVRVWVQVGLSSNIELAGVADDPAPNTFYDGHAFDLRVHVRNNTGSTAVRVWFSNTQPDPGSPPDAQASFYLPPLVPFGAVDNIVSNAAGQVTITGWAVDPAQPGNKVRIFATEAAVEGVAGLPRTDVGNAYPGYGPDHGFHLTGGSSPGTKPICVHALGVNGMTELGCRVVKVNPAGVIEAGIDAATGGPGSVRVAGWAFDYDAPNTPVTMHLYVGGTPDMAGVEAFNLGPADRLRTDVGGSYGVGNYHGFDKTVAVKKFGDQPIYLYALNVDGTPGGHRLVLTKTVHITRDTTPPDTQITAGPVGTVNTGNVSYAFSSTEGGSTFECSWDGEPWTACTSPTSRELGNGPHTFAVRAVDPAGNKDQTPANRGIIVDLGGTNPITKLTLAVKAVKKKSRLRVNVGPDSAAVNYRFKVQRRANGKWKTVKRARTRGPKDVRTLDLRRGVYRVKVPRQFGLPSAKSRKVRLTR